jgi:hypothetical protein
MRNHYLHRLRLLLSRLRNWVFQVHPIPELNIATVRKPPLAPLKSVITTLILDKLDADVHQANGPDAIKTFLALDGYQNPR